LRDSTPLDIDFVDTVVQYALCVASTPFVRARDAPLPHLEGARPALAQRAPDVFLDAAVGALHWWPLKKGRSRDPHGIARKAGLSCLSIVLRSFLTL
jgi:hypothetical protein